MGGRGGQSIGSAGAGVNGGGGNVSQADYDFAIQDGIYKDRFNPNVNTIEDRTINAYTNEGYQVNKRIRDDNLNDVDKQYMQNLDKSLAKRLSFLL